MPPPFEKAVPLSGNKQTQMKESEKRRFRARLKTLFPSLGEEQLGSLVPPSKSVPLITSKLAPKDELYLRAKDPLFFTQRISSPFSGKRLTDELIPTCYALHAAPQALCRVLAVYRGVDEKIRGGADLFLPGVYRPDSNIFEDHECCSNDDNFAAKEDENLERACKSTSKRWPEVLFGGPVKKGELCCLVLASRPWAPFAIGRFSKSSEDFYMAGRRGVCVEVLHHEGDCLWKLGTMTPPPSEPPATLAAAIAEQKAAEKAAADKAVELAEEVAKQKRAERLEEIPRLRRKVQKSLRQIEELRQKLAQTGRGVADVPQQAKLDREPELRTELTTLDEELEQLQNASAPTERCESYSDVSREGANDEYHAAVWIGPPPPPSQGSTISRDPAVVNESSEADWEFVNGPDAPACAELLKASLGGTNNKDQNCEAGGLGVFEAGEIIERTEGEDEGENSSDQKDEDNDCYEHLPSPNDVLFRDAVLTELSGDCRPSSSKPVLLSTLFGKASARACGVGVKQTSWKKSSIFLENALPEGTIQTRLIGRGATGGKKGGSSGGGIVEIVRFNALLVPEFNHVDLHAVEDTAACSSGVVATKIGHKPATVNIRRVRNNNVTLVDGLEEWGFSKDSMGDLARDLRKQFCVSSAVVERSGTQDNAAKGRRQLWSIQLSGKFGPQVANFLRGRGVAQVKEGGQKGVLTKKDKKAHKNYL